MKPFILLISLALFLSASRKDEIKALYDEVIEKTREDMLVEIKTLKNPFIKPVPPVVQSIQKQTEGNQTQTHQNIVLQLHAIINKQAKINDGWYQKGEILHGYKISSISPYSVSLTSVIDDGRAGKKTLKLLDIEKLDIKHSVHQPEIKVETK